MKRSIRGACAFFLVVQALASCTNGSAQYDLIIKNGSIVDGSGGESYPADIGVRGDTIVTIGEIPESAGKTVIDAAGKTVSPGFIDIHTHSDGILDYPTAHNFIRQGVTTVVDGNCGGSALNIAERLDNVAAQGAALNYGTLIGHNSIRSKVMGGAGSEPTPDELAKMKTLVGQGMRDGALGLSTGLIYRPGVFSTMDEVVELAKSAAAYGGFYATHMRSEGKHIIEAVREAIEIGRRAAVPVQISHLKVLSVSRWGDSDEIIRLIDGAISDGLDITADQYPYTASSTGLAVLIPPWAHEGGGWKEKAQDAALRRKIKDGIKHEILTERAGDDLNRIRLARYEADESLEGLGLADILGKKGRGQTLDDAAELALELAGAGNASAVYHAISEDDVARIMRHSHVMHASDAHVTVMGEGVPHPRCYGTFPRVLSAYVREQGVLSLEEAIRKMTSLPADRIGAADRGRIQEGCKADLVVFDPDTIADTATFQSPHSYPAGIEYVIVNGVKAVDHGEIQNSLSGQVIYGPGRSGNKESAGTTVSMLTDLIGRNESDIFPVAYDVEPSSMHTLPIGVFDSGIGGLTVLSEIVKLDRFNNITHASGPDGIPDFEHEHFIYLGDQANMPYGNYPSENKTDFLRELIVKDAAFLLGNRYWQSQDAAAPSYDKPPVKAIVIACNTATAYGIDDVRAALAAWQIPVYLTGVIVAGANGAVEALAESGESGTVAVMATVGTCASDGYVRAVNKAANAVGISPPAVIQQGCLGLAGAIEGDASYIRSAGTAGSDYKGPSTANTIAPLDSLLMDRYAFDYGGIAWDGQNIESMQLNSVDNYIRYHTATLVEQYREKGVVEPISTVILGCTHFPFYSERLQSEFDRLRGFTDSEGSKPYETLIGKQISFIDPAVFTAVQLYEELRDSELLLDASGNAVVTTDEFYISVPHSSTDTALLNENGGFTYSCKYGRTPGEFAAEYVKRVPMSRRNLSPAVIESITAAMPWIRGRITEFNLKSPRCGGLEDSEKITF